MTKQQVITSGDLHKHPGAVLDDVESGTTFTVTRYGKPVAVLRPIDQGLITGSQVEMVREEQASYPLPINQPYVSQPATALIRLIGTASIRSVVAIFLRDPAEAFYQREIARLADVGLRSAQLALDRLEGLGLIASERDGNRRYYRAVRTERFEALRSLFSRELGISEVISRHLAELDKPISWAFVFGSVASGEDVVGSDIDLLIVADVSGDELVKPIADAQRELSREIDMISYRPSEFSRKRLEGDHFVSSVLAGPRLDVIGGPDDPG